MLNPVREIRDLADITQWQLINEAGITQRSVLWEAEAGLFTTLPPRLVSALVKIILDYGLDYDSSDIYLKYRAWQEWEVNKLRGKVLHYPQLQLPDEISPMEDLRQRITPQGLKTFCALLKVPRMTIRRYETGETATMPTILQTRLDQIEYPHTEALKTEQDRWIRGQL